MRPLPPEGELSRAKIVELAGDRASSIKAAEYAEEEGERTYTALLEVHSGSQSRGFVGLRLRLRRDEAGGVHRIELATERLGVRGAALVEAEIQLPLTEYPTGASADTAAFRIALDRIEEHSGEDRWI
jgi:hypothetical protein